MTGSSFKLQGSKRKSSSCPNVPIVEASRCNKKDRKVRNPFHSFKRKKRFLELFTIRLVYITSVQDRAHATL